MLRRSIIPFARAGRSSALSTQASAAVLKRGMRQASGSDVSQKADSIGSNDGAAVGNEAFYNLDRYAEFSEGSERGSEKQASDNTGGGGRDSYYNQNPKNNDVASGVQ